MANQMLYATLQLELREARAELAAAIAERDTFVFELSKSLLESQRRLEQKQDAEAERDALRDALQSLVDGKSEYGVAQVAGVDTTEARRIMDLAYNRK